MADRAKLILSGRLSLGAAFVTLLLSACVDYGPADWIVVTHTVDTVAEHGAITPARAKVRHGEMASFSLHPAENYLLQEIDGCRGSLSGNTYTTGVVTGDCTITAIFRISSHWVDTEATAGGGIQPQRLQVRHGDSADFALTPDTGYHIDSVTGCSGTLNGNHYTTGPIGGTCTIDATFTRNSYTLSAGSGAGGTISPASAVVLHGDSADFTLTPDTGYHIDSVTGCSGTLNGDSYTTGLISGACTVSATFRLNRYSLTSTAGLGGSISPTSVEILHGDSATSPFQSRNEPEEG